MIHPESKKLQRINQSINRLQAQKSLIQNSVLHQSKAVRRARTRTLIQGGSLVNIIGLFNLCDIQEGDDLQKDIFEQNKAAVLFGILTTFVEQLPATLTKEQIAAFQEKGLNGFKRHYAKKHGI